MSRIVSDSRTPYVVNVGVLTFAVIFAKAMGFIPPVAEIKALLRRASHHMPPPSAGSLEEGRADVDGKSAGEVNTPRDGQRCSDPELASLSRPATGNEHSGLSIARTVTVTEDDLNYYYGLVETLWLGGFGTTIERIQDRTSSKDAAHISLLNEGLGVLVERSWLKVQQFPIATWSEETVYETVYVPVRGNS